MEEKRGLPLEEHLKMGPYLTNIFETFLYLRAEVANTEGRGSDVVKQFDKAIEELGQLRFDLEEKLCEYYPNELNQLAKIGYNPSHIYFGPPLGR